MGIYNTSHSCGHPIRFRCTVKTHYTPYSTTVVYMSRSVYRIIDEVVTLGISDERKKKRTVVCP